MSAWHVFGIHDVRVALLGGVFLLLGIEGLTTGEVLAKGGRCRREERPFAFGFLVSAYMFVGICVTLMGILGPPYPGFMHMR